MIVVVIDLAVLRLGIAVIVRAVRHSVEVEIVRAARRMEEVMDHPVTGLVLVVGSALQVERSPAARPSKVAVSRSSGSSEKARAQCSGFSFIERVRAIRRR